MYCRNCNKMIPDGTTFCPYCGTPQQVQNNDAGYQNDDSATVLVQDGNMGYPNGGFQPPVNPGYPQPAAPYQQPVNPGYQAPVTPDYPQQGQNAGFQQMPPVNPGIQQPAPAKKSKTGLIIGLVCGGVGLLVVIAVIVAVFAFGSSDDYNEYDNIIDYEYDDFDDVIDDYDDSADSDNDADFPIYPPSDDSDSEYVFSSAFQDILDDNALTFECFDFDYLDYSVFAKEDANGMIDIQEIGSDDDVVYEMYETICVPTTGYSQDQLDALDKNMQEAYAGYEDLSCCLVDYYQLEDFYVIELYIWGLDDSENISDLSALGFIENGWLASYISYSNTKDNLIGSGYVEG